MSEAGSTLLRYNTSPNPSWPCWNWTDRQNSLAWFVSAPRHINDRKLIPIRKTTLHNSFMPLPLISLVIAPSFRLPWSLCLGAPVVYDVLFSFCQDFERAP